MKRYLVTVIVLSALAVGSAASVLAQLEPRPRVGYELHEVPPAVLIGLDVLNAAGDQVGEIEDVVVDPNDRLFALVEIGAGFDLRDERVLIPFAELLLAGDNVLLLSPVSEDALEAMAGYDPRRYRPYRPQ